MTKKTILGVMLVLVLAFGMMVVGCGGDEDDDDYDDRPVLYGYVSLDNDYPVVGETITASYKESPRYPPIGTPSWRWYKYEEGTRDFSSGGISIGAGNTYTARQSDVGFLLYAKITYSGNKSERGEHTSSTVIGIPATATVSVSIKATRALIYDQSPSVNNHYVRVTLTLSDGKWNDVSYSTASPWITMSGTPDVSSWTTGIPQTPSVYAAGRELHIGYGTRSETTLSISGLTATLNTAQLSTMRNSTNVYNSLTAGTSTTASVSQWTMESL